MKLYSGHKKLLPQKHLSSKLNIKEIWQERNAISGISKPIEIKSEAVFRSTESDFKLKASNEFDKNFTKLLDLDKSSYWK